MAMVTRNLIKCALVNIQSVGNKTCEIRDFINDDKLDVLVLTETWLNLYDNAKIKEIRLFNRLPLDVKQSPTCATFKKRLKTYLFSNCYDIQRGELNQPYCV